MYKAIIVDDEHWIVEGLKAGINWEEYNFEIVGTAFNGQDGLQLIESLRPDFVLTDIKMPLISGLELIKNGKKISPHTEFVVLSGHAEFAYAQKALNYGTFGYCLKPFEIEEIQQLLEKVSQRLDQKSNQSTEHLDNQRLYEYICTSNETEIQHILEKVHLLPSNEQPLRPLVILADQSKNVPNNISLYQFRLSRKRTCCLVAQADLESFKLYFENNNEPPYSVGIGSAVTTINQLLPSVEMASTLSYGVFIYEKHGFFDQYDPNHTFIKPKLKQLTEALALKDRVRVQHILNDCLHNGSQQLLTIRDAYWLYSTFLYSFTVDGQDHSIHFLDGNEQLYEDFHSFNAMVQYLLNQSKLLFTEELPETLSHVTHTRIKEILIYIHHEFNKEISIQTLSEKFFLSPTYLSQLFKKEVGENFVEYLSRYRIKYACKLLIETNLTISQIGEQSGFNDYFYFTRIFKRIVGMTPTQYREAN